jgi:hypothetical protein
MRFEKRDLKEHAEPVASDKLQIGEIYFSLQFADEDLLVPILEPLVFVGKQRLTNGEECLLFQTHESYFAGIRLHTSSDNDRECFSAFAPSNLNHVFEFERALDLLLSCSLRRRNM